MNEKSLLLLEKIAELMNLGTALGVGPIITEEQTRKVLDKLFGSDADDVHKLLTARELTNTVQ